MRRALSILGSTGSIGRQTVETAVSLGIPVTALCAYGNIKLLEEQARRLRPEIVGVFDEGSAGDLRVRVRDMNLRVVSGAGGAAEAACTGGADTVVSAVSGGAGLLPTLSAIKLGRRIALANKETLVCAGEIVMRNARESGAEIIPVDSEHSAVFRCIAGADGRLVKKIILTASGGPFRDLSAADMKNVTVEMALKHPVWAMGRKISVDSATMMNKGLEIIEAVHLFGLPPDRVTAVIHPESVIHSMVEFTDNSVMAQLAVPDMRLPIQYALTYPEVAASPLPELDFAKTALLTFREPDTEAFPCLTLAAEAARRGGTAGAVLSGANEAAVDLFLRGKIGFTDIYEAVSAALGSIAVTSAPLLEDILEAGRAAKRFVYEHRY